MGNFFVELRRRKVFRVVGSYAVVSWLLIQIIVSVEEPLQLPDWTDTFVIVTLLAGFPVCAVLAWVFDITGGSISRTSAATDVNNSVSLSARDRLTISLSVLAVILTLGTSAYFVAGGWDSAAKKVAILPFTTVDTGDEFQYIGDGIRDNLITRLSRLRGVQIRSVDAVPGELLPGELGTLIDADILCSGRLEYRGETFDITIELIEAGSGVIVWRERFSSESSNLLEIEALIAAGMVEQLRVDVDEAERIELARASTSNPAAHRLYLQGRYYWNRRTSPGLEASIDYYNNALALDPGFAQAYAGLAQSYLMRLGWGFGDPQTNAQQIIDTARTAIRLDPSLAEPYAALGYFKTIYERDWEGARSDFLQAIENNGNYSSAHHWYAFLLLTLGESRAAVEEILLAREIEPLSPIINAEVGYFYLFDRQYTQAQQELESDQASLHFTEGLTNRTLILSWLRDPLLANYHETAAYAELMESVGLTP